MLRRMTIVAVTLAALACAARVPARASAAPTDTSGLSSQDAKTGDSDKKPHGESSAKEDEGSVANKLNPLTSWKNDLALWTLIVFVVVLLILSKYAWGPIAEGLQKREDEIAGQIAEAQRKNDEARQILAQYEKKLTDATAEVRGLFEQGRRDAEQVGKQLIDKAREEAGIEHQRAVQRIETATSVALKELAEKSATLAVELAGKIVGTQLKAADHSRLINDAVTGFTQAGQAKVNGSSKG